MKSKPPLILMEQMVMLLVFALAAALCLQAFVKSDSLSRRSEARDRAAALCQCVAETVRDCQGDMAAAAASLEGLYPYGGGGNPFEIHYSEDWTVCDTREYTFCLRTQLVDSGVDSLGKALVEVVSADDQTVVFEIQVSWQEVSGRAG